MRLGVSLVVALLVVLPSSLLLWLLRTGAQSRLCFVSIAALCALVLVVLSRSVRSSRTCTCTPSRAGTQMAGAPRRRFRSTASS
jgi:hypothetical protein